MLSFYILFLIPLFLIHPHKLFSIQLGPGTASLACARLIVPFAPFSDIGGQQSSSSLYLFTASGFFHETLGGHSCSLEVSLSKLQKDICKEQSVSELPIRVVCLWRRFFKL